MGWMGCIWRLSYALCKSCRLRGDWQYTHVQTFKGWLQTVQERRGSLTAYMRFSSVACHPTHINCESNIFPISYWSRIGLELDLNWTWIGVATALHQKKSEIKVRFADIFPRLCKKSFSVFPITLSYLLCISALCVTVRLFSCHIAVTRQCMRDRCVTEDTCSCHT